MNNMKKQFYENKHFKYYIDENAKVYKAYKIRPTIFIDIEPKMKGKSLCVTEGRFLVPRLMAEYFGNYTEFLIGGYKDNNPYNCKLDNLIIKEGNVKNSKNRKKIIVKYDGKTYVCKTYKECADLLGVHYTTLSRYLKGEVATSIIDKLNVRITYNKKEQ